MFRSKIIKINANDGMVELTTNVPKRKYHEVIEIPLETDPVIITGSWR